MKAKTRLAGRSIHRTLVVFPLGLLICAAVFDGIYALTGYTRLTHAAYYMIGVGVLSGFVSAIFGIADFMFIPRRTRAAAIGFVHAIGNFVVLIMFGASFALRRQDDIAHLPSRWALILVALGTGLVLITGWLGGELVERLSVGVEGGAHLNSPSSFSGLPASANDPKYAPGRGAEGPEWKRSLAKKTRIFQRRGPL
jgi:uncharacterized membrane protein